MKKTLAAILAIVFVLCSAAFADTYQIDDRYEIDIPNTYEEGELEEEDIEDDMAAYFINDDGSSEIDVYVYENEGEWTVSELAQSLAEEEGTQSSGTTNINGIEAAYCVYEEDSALNISYIFINAQSNNIIEIAFYIGDESAKTESQTIMNTLTDK